GEQAMTDDRPPWERASPSTTRWGYYAGAAWAVCLCLAAVPAPLALPSAEPPPILVDADVSHELLVRQALARDPILAPLNLGVRLHRPVAVLWGPAPATDL